MAAIEKNTVSIEKIKTFDNVIRGEEYEKMISGMQFVLLFLTLSPR
jgi:hypothetical protein